MKNTRRQHFSLVIGSTMLLTAGCVAVTTHQHPVLPPPIHLGSPTPFPVHVRARADTAATSCEVLRLSGTVAAVRGDTVEFAAMHAERQPRGATDCLRGRPGYVALSGAGDVQGESVTLSSLNGDSLLLTVAVGFAGYFALMLGAVLGYGIQVLLR